jgi:hypothetical protein
LIRALRIFACCWVLSLSATGRAFAQEALVQEPAACPASEVRTRNGVCLPQSTAPVAAAVARAGARTYVDTKDEADSPSAAVLVNPVAMIGIPLLISQVDFALPLELQVGGPGVALDVQLDIVTGTIGGVGSTIGPRFFPAGEGLEGFYLVPRIGGATYAGFVAAFEVGYAAWASAFTVNVGIGVVYINGSYPVVETVAPFLNLSIGLGG